MSLKSIDGKPVYKYTWVLRIELDETFEAWEVPETLRQIAEQLPDLPDPGPFWDRQGRLLGDAHMESDNPDFG